jgi:hypothetical protein
VYSIYGLLPGDDDKLRYVVLLNVFVPIGWIGEAVWTIIFNHEVLLLRERHFALFFKEISTH